MKSRSSKSIVSTRASTLDQAPAVPAITALRKQDGIDYHKSYNVVDAECVELAKGPIQHACPEAFLALVSRWQRPRVVFEATMNWYWLFEVLKSAIPAEDIVLANPWKTRIIADAQVKIDKVDSRILTQLLRADLVCKVHIASKPARESTEVAPMLLPCEETHHLAESNPPLAWCPAWIVPARRDSLDYLPLARFVV